MPLITVRMCPLLHTFPFWNSVSWQCKNFRNEMLVYICHCLQSNQSQKRHFCAFIFIWSTNLMRMLTFQLNETLFRLEICFIMNFLLSWTCPYWVTFRVTYYVYKFNQITASDINRLQNISCLEQHINAYIQCVEVRTYMYADQLDPDLNGLIIRSMKIMF